MPKFRMTIDCDNAAFEGDLERELTRILKIVAHRLEESERTGFLYDLNGNHVGEFSFKETE